MSYEWQLWSDKTGQAEMIEAGTGLTAAQLEIALSTRCGATDEELEAALEVTSGPERASVVLWGDSWVEVARRETPESW